MGQQVKALKISYFKAGHQFVTFRHTTHVPRKGDFVHLSSAVWEVMIVTWRDDSKVDIEVLYVGPIPAGAESEANPGERQSDN